MNGPGAALRLISAEIKGLLAAPRRVAWRSRSLTSWGCMVTEPAMEAAVQSLRAGRYRGRVRVPSGKTGMVYPVSRGYKWATVILDGSGYHRSYMLAELTPVLPPG